MAKSLWHYPGSTEILRDPEGKIYFCEECPCVTEIPIEVPSQWMQVWYFHPGETDWFTCKADFSAEHSYWCKVSLPELIPAVAQTCDRTSGLPDAAVDDQVCYFDYNYEPYATSYGPIYTDFAPAVSDAPEPADPHAIYPANVDDTWYARYFSQPEWWDVGILGPFPVDIPRHKANFAAVGRRVMECYITTPPYTATYDGVYAPGQGACPSFTPMAIPVATRARNLLSATARWTKAGMPVVTDEQYHARLALCAACPEWRVSGNLGFGKCLKCGCTRLKHRLATERCPLGKWERVEKTK